MENFPFIDGLAMLNNQMVTIESEYDNLRSFFSNLLPKKTLAVGGVKQNQARRWTSAIPYPLVNIQKTMENHHV